MARQQTKKNYSLRKLKTGTASVAVALTVLGAGFANQTEVRADQAASEKVEVKESEKETKYKTLALRGENADLRNVNAKYLEKINAEEEKNKKLEATNKELEAKHQKLEAENKKLTEANQVSEASRKGLSNDLEASRAAKKELEAKHQKLEADHQALEAKHQ
ncbi:YSIRK-type signal peptide-containing protein, partial [Streptococcus pyogenes]